MMNSASAAVLPTHRRTTDQHAHRRGSVLLLVLAVMLLLLAAALTWSATMVTEVDATRAFADRLVCRSMVDGGIDYCRAVLHDAALRHDLVTCDARQLFGNIPVSANGPARDDARISVVCEVIDDWSPVHRSSQAGMHGAGLSIGYGLADESAKLNINALPAFDTIDDPTRARGMLLPIPGMTVQLADAILDWIDSDDRPRPFGAEASWYASQARGQQPPNHAIVSLSQLLPVRGVTPELLFGMTSPIGHHGKDFVGGMRGWIRFLSTVGASRNLRADGQPRINLNMESLTSLYDRIEAEWGPAEATFIVALRLRGPFTVDAPGRDRNDAAEFHRGDGPTTDSAQLDIVQREASAAQRRAMIQSGRDVEATDASGTPPRVAGAAESAGPAAHANSDEHPSGLRLDRRPVWQFESLYDLCGTVVRVMQHGQDTLLDSPWTADPSSIVRDLPELEDRLSISDGAKSFGRININRAPREVIDGIPGMTSQLARAIVAARGDRHLLRQRHGRRSTTAWIVAEGLADITTMRRIGRWITASGDVRSGVVIGHFAAGGTLTASRCVIDATGRQLRPVQIEELSPSAAKRMLRAAQTTSGDRR